MIASLRGPASRFATQFALGCATSEGARKLKPYIDEKIDSLKNRIFTPNPNVDHSKLPK